MMKQVRSMSLHSVLLVFCLACVSVLAACSGSNSAATGDEGKADRINKLTVYKTESCGCCGDWVAHIQEHGFQVDVVNLQSVAGIKDRFGIPANSRSCHTAVSENGLVIEGHVPAKVIHQWFEDRAQDARALIVPAMPVGSPGMEYQNQFNPYSVLQLEASGDLAVYARMETYNDQF